MATPPKIRAAPAAARPERPSPAIQYDVAQATTGSNMKISAVLAGDVYRCAHVMVQKASAVANKPVISIAQTTAGRHAILGCSAQENSPHASTAQIAIWLTANRW